MTIAYINNICRSREKKKLRTIQIKKLILKRETRLERQPVPIAATCFSYLNDERSPCFMSNGHVCAI